MLLLGFVSVAVIIYSLYVHCFDNDTELPLIEKKHIDININENIQYNNIIDLNNPDDNQNNDRDVIDFNKNILHQNIKINDIQITNNNQVNKNDNVVVNKNVINTNQVNTDQVKVIDNSNINKNNIKENEDELNKNNKNELNNKDELNKNIKDEYDIEEITDLWSSYDLEKKYNEMKNKKGLQDYLNLEQWKQRVRKRFSQMMSSTQYSSSPSEFITTQRNKRAKDEYAVVEDTALNLLEYYELVSSQDKSKTGIIPNKK